MVIEIPRPSTKSAIKAKDNSVKGKYTKICLTVQQKRKKGIEMIMQYFCFLPIILTYILKRWFALLKCGKAGAVMYYWHYHKLLATF